MKTRLLIAFLHFQALLSLKAARNVGSILGWICWHTAARMKKTTLTNLRMCFPELTEQAVLSLARNSINQTAISIAETGPVWLWPSEKVLERVLSVSGFEFLQQAHASAQGVVVLAPHLGNWEVFGLYLNNCGLGQTSQLYQAPASASLDKLIFSARSRGGANMVATDTKGVAALLKALRKGEIVGILPDQVPPESGGEFAPFFSHPALTMTLAMRLLQKTGAKVVLGYARRVSEGKLQGFNIHFSAAPEQIYAEHMPNALEAMNSWIESAVNEAPEQYQWEYKRFKRQPEGKQSVYD